MDFCIGERTVRVEAEKSSVKLVFGDCWVELRPRLLSTSCVLDEAYNSEWRRTGYLYLRSRSFLEGAGSPCREGRKKTVYIRSNRVSLIKNTLGEYLVIVTSGYHTVDRLVLFKDLLVTEHSAKKTFMMKRRGGTNVFVQLDREKALSR